MSSRLDHISRLPNEVLCHILSFLPTRTAVSTSLLSKRWRYLWLSVPAVDLSDEPFHTTLDSYLRFVRFAYAAMLSRDRDISILTFRLRSSSPFCYPADIKVWLTAAVKRRVESIELTLSSPVIKFPSAILNCKTLVALKLGRLTVDAGAVSSLSLPLLKILHLELIFFQRRRYLEMLLSFCPVLEDLEIKSLYAWQGDSAVVAGFGRLQKLVRAYISRVSIPFDKLSNAQFLRSPMTYLPNNSGNFHNLIHAELLIWRWPWINLAELLNFCPILHTLVIWNKCLPGEMVFLIENRPYPQSVPECLLSRLRVCSIMDYRGLDYVDFRFARYVMQSARVLRKMTICSASSTHLYVKLEMLKRLSAISRSSADCELVFE